MTADEQYLSSVRYALRPICLALLPSGRIGITSGYTARETLTTIPRGELSEWITEYLASAANSIYEANRAQQKEAQRAKELATLSTNDILADLGL